MTNNRPFPGSDDLPYRPACFCAYKSKIGIFLEPHRAKLISISIDLSQTPANTVAPQMQGIVRLLFTPQLLLVLIVTSHRGIARLS